MINFEIIIFRFHIEEREGSTSDIILKRFIGIVVTNAANLNALIESVRSIWIFVLCDPLNGENSK
jgi:hypothetical protein